jgi:hypothetical protein
MRTLSTNDIDRKKTPYMSVDVKTERIWQIQQHFVLVVIASRGGNITINTSDLFKFPFVLRSFIDSSRGTIKKDSPDGVPSCLTPVNGHLSLYSQWRVGLGIPLIQSGHKLMLTIYEEKWRMTISAG